MLTQKRLREVLAYDPETGVFSFAKGKRKGRVAGTAHDPRGFHKVQIDHERHLLHRLAWLWMTGTQPRWSVEHINGDHSDNRWTNLREGNRPQKTAHLAPWRELTSTPGVWQVGDRFEALVEVDGVMMNLGSFETQEAAATTIAKIHQRARDRLSQQRRAA